MQSSACRKTAVLAPTRTLAFRKAFELPTYKIIEVTKKNGDPKRFYCDILIKGFKESSAFGKSRKQAEKNAAKNLIEKYINSGKISFSN